MTALRAVKPDRLGVLAATINAEHELVWRAGRVALEHAVKAGKALLEAQAEVPKGQWLAWLRDNVTVHATSAYKYMRLARYESQVLASDVQGVEEGLRLVAKEPWHDRSRLSDGDKAQMRALVADHSLEEVAAAFGVAKSTVWRWTSDRSAASRPLTHAKQLARRAPARDTEIDDDLIERVAAWLCERFSLKLNDEARGDAVALIGLVIGNA